METGRENTEGVDFPSPATPLAQERKQVSAICLLPESVYKRLDTLPLPVDLSRLLALLGS